MSITLSLYTNESDDRTLNKVLSPIGDPRTALIKEDTSIIDPVFIVSGNVSALAACNYVTTSGLGGRQYFVKNIKSVGNDMVELECHVDVLSTWAADLGSIEAVVERQENRFNLYLDDGTFKVYSNPLIITKTFSAGFSSPCYVLGIVGGV